MHILRCCCNMSLKRLRCCCRHLRRLLEELLAIARATQGKSDFSLDLSPVGEDFDPQAVV